MDAIHQKYISLLKQFGIQLLIETIDDPAAPPQEIQETSSGFLLKLNPRRFLPDLSYESYVAYNARDILLPNLVLETDRLVIRRVSLEDAEGCFPFLADSEGMYLDCCKAFTSMDEEYYDRIQLFAQRVSQYVITLKDSEQIIGTVNVFEDNTRAVDAMEIGYAVSPAYQRKGYAFEALSALIDLLQNQLQLEMLTAGTLEENHASIQLLQKLGFTKEGIRHKAIWHEALNRPVDLLYFYLDKN